MSGTFFGLADLAQFSVGDDTFQIDYTATTVVLTAVSIPLALTGVAPSVTFAGERGQSRAANSRLRRGVDG